MREKILKALKGAGHGMTPQELSRILNRFTSPGISLTRVYILSVCTVMEQDKLLILHRSSGSAGVPKGEVVLVCLRPEGH